MDKGKQLLLEGSSDFLSQDIVCLSSPNPKLKDKIGEHSVVIKEDLMPKFGEAGLSVDDKSPTVSLAKRSSPTAEDDEDMDLPLKLLKRSIKIEKL
ncbi:replication factor-A carboxy-terminal domain protein [Trifolium medium]|uniref:Replication factor-A carboxy-terminal domain protein n=1 Tax=Trifolium medium TaxID=97028 RepID=A0A392PIL3_9FABA|nr:replication factor-A carboxy-terminal domain protein [Trifolium medium]